MVSTYAVDLLLTQAIRMPGRYQLDLATSLSEPTCQVGGVILHAADAVGRHDARDDADSHVGTVEGSRASGMLHG